MRLWAAWAAAACSRDEEPTGVTEHTQAVQPPASTGAPPGGNVLLLLLDDIGLDKVGVYGVAARPPATPNIDALAAEGMTFANAWALPYCGPTRAALQTGRYPRRTGIGWNEELLGNRVELDPAQTTLAELAATSPWFTYESSYAGKWHLSTYTSPSGTGAPLVQGWGWYAGSLGNLGVWSEGLGPPAYNPGYYAWQKVTSAGELVESNTYATTDTTNDAIDRIAAMSEPWILQVAFNAAHPPFEVPPQDLLASSHPDEPAARERLMVEALDVEIGRLLSAMSEDLRGRTHILVIGDNGTPDSVAEPEIDPDRAKGSLYEPGIRVPFIVNGPLVASPGTVSAALVSVVDVFPTVADIVGVDLSSLPSVLDPDVPLRGDGVSLLPVLAGATQDVHDVVYAELFSPAGPGPHVIDLRAVRDRDYKLVADDVLGIEQFFAYPTGATDEGWDLLPCGLDAEQRAAYDRLSAALAALRAELVFDGFVEEGPGSGSPEPLLLEDIGCDDEA